MKRLKSIHALLNRISELEARRNDLLKSRHQLIDDAKRMIRTMEATAAEIREALESTTHIMEAHATRAGLPAGQLDGNASQAAPSNGSKIDGAGSCGGDGAKKGGV